MEAIIDQAVDTLAGLPLPVVMLVAMLFAAAEVSIGVGVIIPGETGVLALAALSPDWPRPVGLAAAIAAGGILGDSIGYVLGRRYGDRLLDTRIGRRIAGHAWRRAAGALRRRGALAVFGARYVAVLRAVVPAAAGAAGLPYRRFLIGSVAGATSWSIVHVAVGVALGASVRQAGRYFGLGGWVLFAAAVIAAAAFLLHQKRRTKTMTGSDDENVSAAPAVMPAGDRRV